MGSRGPTTNWVLDDRKEPIVGLRLRADGRFYTINSERKSKYFGREKYEAIRRFYVEISTPRNSRIAIQTPPQNSPLGVHFSNAVWETFVDEPSFWECVQTKILDNPQLVAKKVGIPEIAFLKDIVPQLSVTLSDLLDLYVNDKSGEITKNEIANGKTWWNEFMQLTKAKQVSDLTHDAFREYRDTVKRDQKQGKKSNSYTRSRFGKIAAIINHATSEMKFSQNDLICLGYKSLLKKPPKPKAKPLSLEPGELHAILSHAGEFDTAMILMALNCAFYPCDIEALKWEMIDVKNKWLAFDRDKSQVLADESVVRVAVLWERTIEALNKLPRDNEFVFVTREKRPIGNDQANKRFKKLRDLAGIKRDITFSVLRDEAQTRAAQAHVSHQCYRALAGHKFEGVDDNYIRRNPEFVRPATDAILKFYFE